MLEVVARACRELGISSAAVPPTFPVGVADHLRAVGVELVPDRELFEGRRRAKNERELARVRPAPRGAQGGGGAGGRGAGTVPARGGRAARPRGGRGHQRRGEG